jgi:hypothetical protein
LNIIKIILNSLDEFFSLASKYLTTKEEKDKIKSKSDEIRNNLFKLYLDSTITKTFLVVGGILGSVTIFAETPSFIRPPFINRHPSGHQNIP